VNQSASQQIMPSIVPPLLPTHQHLQSQAQANNFNMFPNGIMNINQPLGNSFFSSSFDILHFTTNLKYY
jgi:hypothetical protein